MSKQSDLTKRVEKETSKRTLGRSLTIRIPHDLYATLEELTAEMSKELPGHNPTISDIARGLLEQGIADGKKNERRRVKYREAELAEDIEHVRRQKQEGI